MYAPQRNKNIVNVTSKLQMQIFGIYFPSGITSVFLDQLNLKTK